MMKHFLLFEVVDAENFLLPNRKMTINIMTTGLSSLTKRTESTPQSYNRL